MIEKRFGAVAALACAAALGAPSAQAAESNSAATFRVLPATGIPHLTPVAPQATGAKLGSPEATRLPVLKIANPLAGGIPYLLALPPSN